MTRRSPTRLLMCLASFAGSIEIAVRLYAAVFIAPDLMAYGFRASRTTIHTAVGSYRKFQPHQIRYDRDVNGKRFTVRMNDHGFRGASVTGARPHGVVRVVTLGASSTFGYRNRDGETYPSRLAEALKASDETVRFEVVNLGIPHLDSREISALFAAEALSLDPDVVTFYEGANDARRHDDALAFRNGSLTLSDRSLTAGILNQAILSHMDILSYREPDVAAEADQVAGDLLRNVSGIAAECRRRGIVFVVANQQMKSLVIDSTQIRGVTYAEEERIVRKMMDESGRLSYAGKHFLIHARLVSRLQAWALATGVPFVDVIGALDSRRDYLLSWVHLHPEANRIIAREFAKAISTALPATHVADGS